MRLSAFEGFLLWFVIIIGMIAFGILTNYTIISFMFLLLGVILLAFITISFTDEIRNIFVFKYKIIEKKNVVGRTEFEVKKLICFWWLQNPIARGTECYDRPSARTMLCILRSLTAGMVCI